MIVLKPKGIKLGSSSRDALKATKALTALNKVSEKKAVAITPERSPDKKGTTIKVNASGNFRGMHGNQPSRSPEEMRRVRAMQRLDNKLMPVLKCDTCVFANSCPQFRAGYQCAFVPFFKAHKIRTEDDLIFYMGELAGQQMQRCQMLLLAEKLQGGKPDREASETLALAFDQLVKMNQVLESKNKVDISIETDDTSVLGKLFGNIDSLVDDTEAARKEDLRVDNADEALMLENGLEEHSDNELIRELATKAPQAVEATILQ